MGDYEKGCLAITLCCLGFIVAIFCWVGNLVTFGYYDSSLSAISIIAVVVGILGFVCFMIVLHKKPQTKFYRHPNHANRYISADVQREVWARDGGSCVNCDSEESLEFDHVIPYSKGGSNSAANIQLLCCECNRRKSSTIGGERPR